MEIREVAPDELGDVAALVEGAYRPFLGDHLLDGPYLQSLRDVARRAQEAVVLVAVEAGAVLGSVTYVPGPGPWAELDDPDAAGIRMLAVAGWARGRGVGTALVEACLARAVAAGRRRVALRTVAAMTEAQRLYERLGFVRSPGHDWTLPVGEVLIAYEWRDLSSPEPGT